MPDTPDPPTEPERRPDGTFIRRGRGYERPPFEPDNVKALTHGARSERTVQPVAEQIVGRILEALRESEPWLDADSPILASAVAAVARTESRVALLASWLRDRGDVDQDGEPRNAARLLNQTEYLLAHQRAALIAAARTRVAATHEQRTAKKWDMIADARRRLYSLDPKAYIERYGAPPDAAGTTDTTDEHDDDNTTGGAA